MLVEKLVTELGLSAQMCRYFLNWWFALNISNVKNADFHKFTSEVINFNTNYPSFLRNEKVFLEFFCLDLFFYENCDLLPMITSDVLILPLKI